MGVLSRRTFLQGAAGAGIVAATPGWARKHEVNVRAGAFAQGVASGIPALHGATLWTRVDGLERAGLITLEVATDRGFANVVERRHMRVTPDADGTGRVHIGGLPAGSEVLYRFHTRTTEPAGRACATEPA